MEDDWTEKVTCEICEKVFEADIGGDGWECPTCGMAYIYADDYRPLLSADEIAVIRAARGIGEHAKEVSSHADSVFGAFAGLAAKAITQQWAEAGKRK